jgi:monooxygenase
MNAMKAFTDVLIVGAGLSGIGAAYHLQKQSPGTSYRILEGRDAIGGTWDLFQYPGIRSDSDMFTLGYNFKPWKGGKVLADGPAIKAYVTETATNAGIDQHIQFQHEVLSAAWSTAKALWTVIARDKNSGRESEYTCNFLYLCAGYYSYKTAHTPEFDGLEDFSGQLIHPQYWPKDCDYSGKKVVIIGSGATAVTLVPAMAEQASRVVMLQRSPSYMLSRPQYDALGGIFRKLLPEKTAYALTRWKNIRQQWLIYTAARLFPTALRNALIAKARKQLPPGYDVETHFTPSYQPWDERLCAIPDNDLYRTIREGKAEVVTDQIERFTEHGIMLKSGDLLEADIIVTATGLQLVVNGEINFTVDDQPVNFADTFTYKGMMFSGVPNLVNTFGYINSSWTLRADLISEFVCRLVNQLKSTGMRQVTATLRPEDETMQRRPFITDFSAGYITRFADQLTHQGDKEPWVNCQNYSRERRTIGQAQLDDGVLVFDNPDLQLRTGEP